MTNQHPITPPPELVQRWGNEFTMSGVPYDKRFWTYEQHIATAAAQWGSDQEWLSGCDSYARELRAARCPKTPSLKEQALTALHAVATGANDTREQHQDLDTIRRALEQLND